MPSEEETGVLELTGEVDDAAIVRSEGAEAAARAGMKEIAGGS